MTDPVVMSSSSLTTLLRCGLQWSFAYVDQIRMPPSVRQLIGTATHEAVAVNLEQKITSEEDLPLTDVLDAYATSWDREAGLVEQPEEPLGPAKDGGAGLVRLHHKEVAPNIKPLAVEKSVQFRIAGYEYSTYIDTVAQGPEGKVVRELKTAKRTPDGANHMLQLVGATLGERQASGEVEAGMQLDVLVRTKVPNYHTVTWGQMTNATIGVFQKQIETANKMVKTGLFPATGLQNGSCSWCGYTAICPAYKAAFGTRRP